MTPEDVEKSLERLGEREILIQNIRNAPPDATLIVLMGIDGLTTFVKAGKGSIFEAYFMLDSAKQSVRDIVRYDHEDEDDDGDILVGPP